ncbi:MAG: DUF456 domain-containing protein [Bacteroidetes bacterium]|nr:DUF456 domain-containing protein [Bacteroidota bacterium]
MSELLWVLSILLVIAGIVGVVVPLVPGSILVFGGLVLAASIDGFQQVGWVTITILAVCVVLSYATDFIAAGLGAKRARASTAAIVGAIAGMIIGLFFGLAGVVLGPFLGAVIGEFVVGRDIQKAGKVGVGTWIGMVLGTAARLALVFVMIGIFVLAYLL